MAAVGLTAIGAIVVHEMRSYFALKEVEANQQHLAVEEQNLQHAEVREAIRNVMKTIPLDDKTKAALQTFQRQLQLHHSPAQQIEIFSQTVMPPLDRRAEAVVRRTSARAFGVTAISPTAVTDAVFFIALSIRMVREIATCYGHRPSTVATVHLLRRLVVEAGKLGAVDFAGAALTQHIGGAIARTPGDRRRGVRLRHPTHGAARLGDNEHVPSGSLPEERTPRHHVVIDRQFVQADGRSALTQRTPAISAFMAGQSSQVCADCVHLSASRP